MVLRCFTRCSSDVRRYFDEEYEYRHVILPKPLAKYLPTDRLLSEAEWRDLGVRQSPGWVHYMIHNPEPHVMLFRRELNYQEKRRASRNLV